MPKIEQIAVLMAVCALTQTAFLHQCASAAYAVRQPRVESRTDFSRCFETGMRIRAGLIGALYGKALRLSNTERGARASGDIVNLQSTDTTRLQDVCQYGLILWCD